jgi:hypothetical protein
MIDYSEMILILKTLTRDVHDDLNNKTLEEAKVKAEKLEMAAMMLKNYIDWRLNSK